MKISIQALVLASAFFIHATSSQAVVFGTDDRRDVTANSSMERLARGTAMMVSPIYSPLNTAGSYDLDFTPLSDPSAYALCPSERFAKQPANQIACTGFLIAPDLLLTAGHCALNEGIAENQMTPHCESFQWVFDYQADHTGSTQLKSLPADRIAKCKRVVYAVHQSKYDVKTDHHEFLQDFAIIELERPMHGRPLFKLSGQELVKGQKLSIIGYPSGLPAKFAGSARALDVRNSNYASTNLDVMGGNSGGPVLNEKNEVVAILVRAFPDVDYVTTPGASCTQPNRCLDDGTGCTQDDKKYPAGTQVQKLRAVLERVSGILKN